MKSSLQKDCSQSSVTLNNQFVDKGFYLAVVNLNVVRTSLFAGGESFGEGGQYQLIEGTVYFAVDPSDSVNDRVTDIHLGVNG